MTVEDQSRRRDIYQTVALRGPALLLEVLVPLDQLETEYQHFTDGNARDFLLLKMLVEVQKTGFAFKRWRAIVPDHEEKVNEASAAATRMNLESIIDEQNLWHRKLLEILVQMVNFGRIGDARYFYHFLLLHELERHLAMLREQADFYSGESELTAATVDQLRLRIAEVEATLGDLSQCRYLKTLKPRTQRKGSGIQSFREQLKLALGDMSKHERTAVAYTYSQGFGEASAAIHFNPCGLDYTDLRSRFDLGEVQCWLLVSAILRRAHKISGVQPTDINVAICAETDETTKSMTPLTSRARVGDFVLASGPYLGEVRDVTVSSFGYENYRIKYLLESPLAGIEEAWVPALHVHLFAGKGEIAADLKKLLAEQLGEEAIKRLDAEGWIMDESVRWGAVEAWKRWFRDYVRRSGRWRKRGDRGLGYGL